MPNSELVTAQPSRTDTTMAYWRNTSGYAEGSMSDCQLRFYKSIFVYPVDAPYNIVDLQIAAGTVPPKPSPILL